MAKKVREAKDRYLCEACGNNTFTLEDQTIRYPTDTRIHRVLKCTQCGRWFDVQPCNINGLRAVKI